MRENGRLEKNCRKAIKERDVKTDNRVSSSEVAIKAIKIAALMLLCYMVPCPLTVLAVIWTILLV